ncbi:YceD family protein [Halorhodospira halochloris]|nr:YceD family protein [Halorhodospira halochloris]MBK1652090.1 hypothetical protein [Halorhodospira halochloris]MCG5530772.1 YceD family protein [Halorhodospira halochloris]
MPQPMLPQGLTPDDFGPDAPTYAGELALGQMARLVPLLAEAHGGAHLVIAGRVDECGRRFVEGSVTAELILICQRCLGAYPHAVEEEFRLTLVSSEAEGEELPDDLEPFVSAGGRVQLMDLAEEELLLALPVVARHREGECSPPPNRAGISREELSPFAQLRGVFGDDSCERK